MPAPSSLKPRGSVLGLLLSVAILPAGVFQAREPVFEMTALGVLGGDDDRNLSSYLLGKTSAPATMMIDAGSISQGVVAWNEKEGKLATRASRSRQAAAVKEVLAGIQALLITHSHFDHVAGFVLNSPLLIMSGRRSPLELIALPETIEALREHVLTSPVWLDLTSLPPQAPSVKYSPLANGEKRAVGSFAVEAILLSHTVPSAAFLISAGQDAYLHLGDTGPTQAAWDRVRPLLKSRQLRAVAIEAGSGLS